MITVTFTVAGSSYPFLATHKAKSVEELIKEFIRTDGAEYQPFIEFKQVTQLVPQQVPVRDDLGRYLGHDGTVVATTDGKFLDGKTHDDILVRTVPDLIPYKAANFESGENSYFNVAEIRSINKAQKDISNFYQERAAQMFKEIREGELVIPPLGTKV